MNADRRRKKSKLSHGGGVGAVTQSGTPKQLQRKQNGSQPSTSSTSLGPPTASRRADNEEGAGVGRRWLTLTAVVTVAAVLAAVLAVSIIVLGWADSGTLSGLHGGGENVDPSPRKAGPPAPPVTLDPGDPQPPHEPPTTSTPQDSAPKAQPAPTKPKKPKLLNKFDRAIKEELDAAEKLRKKGSMQEALQAFTELVQTFPSSPRARYGKAQAEDDLAEKQRSNEQLARAIATYAEVADLPDAPAELVQLALKRQANRLQFLGRMRAAVAALRKLVQRYPADVALQNELGVALLLQGDNKGAKVVYEEVLARSPDDGFAKVHFGFILKAENKIAESIPFLRAGLESEAPGTNDGRFYFHLGDALQRMGERDEAYRWYAQGHEQGHFSSVFQRSLYNVRGLKAQPWWTPHETGYTELVKALERGWRSIRDEALAAMDVQSGFFLPEEENLREKGDWAQFTLWQQGRKSESGCGRAPTTCSIMERFPESTGCTRGQVKFSVMHPGTHVWPHTGPTNCRLRLHLGLVIPTPGCRIRCANDTREWQEGKVLIFDDSFEHEVWQDADRARLIFIVDVWHPQLTAHQRRTLSPI